jgi:Flp pilus assembly protein TadD
MREHARALLRIDPDHAFANYMMGSLLAQQGESALAEDSYRRSLEKDRDPPVLSVLALLLQKRGDYPEAERLVREAIAANSRMPRAWDTLGVILVKSGSSTTNRLAEAERAFETALSLAPSGPFICLHMADLQVKMGKKERARELVGKVLPRRSALPAEEQKELDRLVESLGVKVE